MNVEILKPIGYCYGVIKAINLAKDIRLKYPDKRILIFGMLVHNNDVTKELENLGIQTINLMNKSPLEELKKLQKGDILIFTAHGHPHIYEEILNEKGITFFDATCFRVSQAFELIKEAKEVIYIGIKSHPETIAALTMNPNIHLYDLNSPFDYENVKTSDPIVINQTTLSYLELENIHQDILKNIPKAIITSEICDATYLRQIAIKNLDSPKEGLIIVGSHTSSNTTRLYELAKEYQKTKKILWVENVDELKKCSIDFKSAIICSGTSTPIATINEIKDYLERM